MPDPTRNVPTVGHFFARIEGLYNFVVVAAGSIQLALTMDRKLTAQSLPGAMSGSSLFKVSRGRTIDNEERETFLTALESQHSLHVTAVILMFSFFEDFLESTNGNTDIETKIFAPPAQLQSNFTWEEIVETNRMLCWLIKEVRNAWVHRDGLKGTNWQKRETARFPALAGNLASVERIYPGMGKLANDILRIPLTDKVLVGDSDLGFATNAKNVLLDRAQLEAGTYQLAQADFSYEFRPPFTR